MKKTWVMMVMVGAAAFGQETAVPQKSSILIELNIGLAYGSLKNTSSESDFSANPNFPAETFSLHGSVYLTYPFTLSDRFSLFPLAGIDYTGIVGIGQRRPV
jgi:hypothetical protein